MCAFLASLTVLLRAGSGLEGILSRQQQLHEKRCQCRGVALWHCSNDFFVFGVAVEWNDALAFEGVVTASVALYHEQLASILCSL
jgi:hypothetical protein